MILEVKNLNKKYKDFQLKNVNLLYLKVLSKKYIEKSIEK